MAMRALQPARLRVVPKTTIRQTDIFREEDLDDFMRTFDTAITVGENIEWEGWARKHMVDQRMVRDAELMLISFLGLSSFITDPYNRWEKGECTHLVEEHLRGVNSQYLTFLFCLIR